LIGTSYTRWGRKTCEGNATLVYKGNIYIKSVIMDVRIGDVMFYSQKCPLVGVVVLNA